MAATLCRIGDTLQLDEFNHGLLETMLNEEVPQVVTLEQARVLVSRVKGIAESNMQYGMLLKGFLTDIEELLGV